MASSSSQHRKHAALCLHTYIEYNAILKGKENCNTMDKATTEIKAASHNAKIPQLYTALFLICRISRRAILTFDRSIDNVEFVSRHEKQLVGNTSIIRDIIRDDAFRLKMPTYILHVKREGFLADKYADDIAEMIYHLFRMHLANSPTSKFPLN